MFYIYIYIYSGGGKQNLSSPFHLFRAGTSHAGLGFGWFCHPNS